MRYFLRSASREQGGGVARIQKSEADCVYQSVIVVASKRLDGVRFTINRISFGRRLELSRRVRELTRKAEFLEAGTELGEKIEAGILMQEVDALYLRWGLVTLEGLRIDGEPATVDQLLDRGPEELTREIIQAIKEQCGLSEAERKN